MAVTYNAVGGTSNNSTTTTIEWSHTCSGSDRLLVVGVALRNPSSQTCSGVTYNGTAMTLIKDMNAGGIRVYMYGLAAPDSGSAYTVSATLSANAYVACGSVSYTGVQQSPAWRTGATAYSDGATVTITYTGGAAGDLIVDAGGVRGNRTKTVGAGQTQRRNIQTTSYGDADAGIVMSEEAGAASVVMSWTLSAGNPWVTTAVALIPSPITPIYKATSDDIDWD